MRPARKSLMSNQRVPVSECGEFQVRQWKASLWQVGEMRRTQRSVLKTPQPLSTISQQQVLGVVGWTTYFVSRTARMPWGNPIKYINELGMIFKVHWVSLRYCHWDSSLRALSNEIEGQPANLLYMAESNRILYITRGEINIWGLLQDMSITNWFPGYWPFRHVLGIHMDYIHMVSICWEGYGVLQSRETRMHCFVSILERRINIWLKWSESVSIDCWSGVRDQFLSLRSHQQFHFQSLFYFW